MMFYVAWIAIILWSFDVYHRRQRKQFDKWKDAQRRHMQTFYGWGMNERH